MERSHVHVTIGVSDFSFSKIVVIESTLELSIFFLADQMPLTVFFVFGPRTFVCLLWRLIVSMPLFNVVYPLTPIKVILITIVVSSCSVFLSMSKVSLVNCRKLAISWLLEKQLSETMNLSIWKISFIHNIATFEVVSSFSIKKTFLITATFINIIFGSEKIWDWKFFDPTAYLVNIRIWAHLVVFGVIFIIFLIWYFIDNNFAAWELKLGIHFIDSNDFFFRDVSPFCSVRNDSVRIGN